MTIKSGLQKRVKNQLPQLYDVIILANQNRAHYNYSRYKNAAEYSIESEFSVRETDSVRLKMVSLAGQICEVCCPFFMHVCRNCANHRVCASAIYGRAIEACWPTQSNRVTGEGVCEHCHMEFLAFLILQCVLDENILTEHAPCIIVAAKSVRNPERRDRIFRNIYEANILHPVVEILLIARWIPPQSIVDEMVVHDDTQCGVNFEI